MISSEALYLGPLMLPWTLIILIIALTVMALLGKYAGQRLNWSDNIKSELQDSIWTSVWVGLISARLVFILLNIEAYAASPIDMIKIQDKGFHLMGGVVAGGAWFYWKNRNLMMKAKVALMLSFTAAAGAGLLLQTVLQQETHYPDLHFSVLQKNGAVSAKQAALSSFEGKPTVVNLWASWCPPCHREMPVLARAQSQHPNVQFVMLNQGEDSAAVSAYLKRHQFDFQHVLLDTHGEVPAAMNMFGLPSTLFFDAQGRLLERHMGELTPAMLQQYLNKHYP
ncbi:TlpA disulfide reductase family protein [Acinetobacter tianfuensis]|uniref:TlpA family protein disulfide reductase n=1 Tax=Acinetobacter tianfuensis TaxID=2419603 RepID=A0A3A8EM05_9GAMM|nr:TlpA disulfide reductase family protein [Acinetobacter tianfuensis]RKG29891.1 TlpA family protein disulfide reductase [Acinetobacter tianfuensis]